MRPSNERLGAPPPAPAMERGKRARTKEANRAAILDAARRVFAELGYDAATIRDVVRESGLSPGTFYNYFPDKQAVFRVLIDDVLERLRPRLTDARAAATNMERFLFDAFHATVVTLYEDRDMLEVVGNSPTAFRAHLHDGDAIGGLFAELRGDLERASRRGILPLVPFDLVATAMLGATVEVCVHLARQGVPDERTAEATARFLADLFGGGLERFAHP